MAQEIRSLELPPLKDVCDVFKTYAASSDAIGEPYATYAAIERMASHRRISWNWTTMIEGLSDATGYIPAAAQEAILQRWGGGQGSSASGPLGSFI